jgi:hypothetical protein
MLPETFEAEILTMRFRMSDREPFQVTPHASFVSKFHGRLPVDKLKTLKRDAPQVRPQIKKLGDVKHVRADPESERRDSREEMTKESPAGEGKNPVDSQTLDKLERLVVHGRAGRRTSRISGGWEEKCLQFFILFAPRPIVEAVPIEIN